MTALSTISIAELKKQHDSAQPSTLYARKAQYAGRTHLHDLGKQPPFTIVQPGEEVEIPKRSWFEILDSNDCAMRYYTHTKATVSGPALVRITEKDTQGPTLSATLRAMLRTFLPGDPMAMGVASGVLLLTITTAASLDHAPEIFTILAAVAWALYISVVVTVLICAVCDHPATKKHHHAFTPKVIAAFKGALPSSEGKDDPDASPAA